MSKSNPLIRPIRYPKGNAEFRTSAELAAINDAVHAPENAEQIAELKQDRHDPMQGDAEKS